MNDFDKLIKSKAAKEISEVPESVKIKIEETLAQLPEKKTKTKQISMFARISVAAACLVFAVLILLPNLSETYAQALEKIPVLGDIVKVVTIRNYFYSDGRHEMDVDVPKVDGEEDAVDYINKDVSELTTALVNQFYKDLKISGNHGYGSINVDYEVVTNTKSWFTLKLSVNETAASSNSYYKFYHIDKVGVRIIKLGDLFNTDEFSKVLVEEIKKQMQEQMKKDESVRYWIADSDIVDEFASVSADHNFYWNNKGELVIVFDKYEVGPGSVGTPEFVVGKDIIKDILKPEFKNINMQ